MLSWLVIKVPLLVFALYLLVVPNYSDIKWWLHIRRMTRPRVGYRRPE